MFMRASEWIDVGVNDRIIAFVRGGILELTMPSQTMQRYKAEKLHLYANLTP